MRQKPASVVLYFKVILVTFFLWVSFCIFCLRSACRLPHRDHYHWPDLCGWFSVRPHCHRTEALFLYFVLGGHMLVSFLTSHILLSGVSFGTRMKRHELKLAVLRSQVLQDFLARMKLRSIGIHIVLINFVSEQHQLLSGTKLDHLLDILISQNLT